MPNVVLDNEIEDMFNSYLNGNVTSSLDEFISYSPSDKSKSVAYISETWGSEKAILFVYSYLRRCE